MSKEKEKRRYAKYPEYKEGREGWFGEAKGYRINPRVRYLKPIQRTTKTKGKRYTHYVISTTVPEEWKHGVKVTIEPVKEPIENLRGEERHANEQGARFWEMVEKHFEEEEKMENERQSAR